MRTAFTAAGIFLVATQALAAGEPAGHFAAILVDRHIDVPSAMLNVGFDIGSRGADLVPLARGADGRPKPREPGSKDKDARHVLLQVFASGRAGRVRRRKCSKFGQKNIWHESRAGRD